MGNICGSPKSGKMVVRNDSDQALEVCVAQETKRRQEGELKLTVGADCSGVGDVVSNESKRDDPKELIGAGASLFKGSGGGNKKFTYVLDLDAFVTVRPGKYMTFNLASGDKKEVRAFALNIINEMCKA